MIFYFQVGLIWYNLVLTRWLTSEIAGTPSNDVKELRYAY